MTQEGFSTPEVCTITKLPYGTLFDWMKSGLVAPSITKPQGRGKHARWGFKDVVAIQTVQKLREHGVSFQGLRKVVQYIQSHLDIENPLSECWLATDGQEVYMLDGDALLSLLRKRGQRTLFHLLNMRETTKALRAKVIRLEPSRRQKAHAAEDAQVVQKNAARQVG